MTPASRTTPALVLALLLLTTLAFWPGLSGGFIFDDYPNIVQKNEVHATALTASELAKAVDAYNGPIGRPFATISFAVDHAIWGLNPWGFKLGNLLVHLLNALLVFVLVRRLLPASPATAMAAAAPAFAISLAWAIHPLQVSTVNYVVQRMEILSLTFVLLGLLAYLHGRHRQINGQRGWPWIVGSATLGLLGLTAKETSALLPAYTLALELTVLSFAAATPAASTRWKAGYGIATAAGIGLFLLLVVPVYVSPDAYAVRDYSATERVLTQFRILPMYLGWIVLPQPGNYLFYYDHLQASRGLLTPATTLAGALFLTALLALSIGMRRRMPLLSLGLFWFFAAHLLSSNVVPLELVFEHRNYFALLGIVLAVAALVQRMPASEIPRLRPATVGIVLAGLMVLTLIRSATWGDPLHLAMSLAARNPESSRASTDLGEQFMLRARRDPASRFYAMAETEFERGSRVPNASPIPEQGLIILAATAGKPAKGEWWDRVVQKLNSRAIGPQEFSMLTNLLQLRNEGVMLDDRRFADAYLVLVNRMQIPASQYYAFGDHALRHLGDEELADQLFKRAVEQGANEPELVAAMVDALVAAGKLPQARAMAGHARALGIAEIAVPDTQPADDEDASP